MKMWFEKIRFVHENKLFYYYTTKLEICKEIFCEFSELCLLRSFGGCFVRLRRAKVIGNGT